MALNVALRCFDREIEDPTEKISEEEFRLVNDFQRTVRLNEIQNMARQSMSSTLSLPSSSLSLPPSSMLLPPSPMPLPPSSLSLPPSSMPLPPSSLPLPPSSMPLPLSSLPLPSSSFSLPSSVPSSPPLSLPPPPPPLPSTSRCDPGDAHDSFQNLFAETPRRFSELIRRKQLESLEQCTSISVESDTYNRLVTENLDKILEIGAARRRSGNKVKISSSSTTSTASAGTQSSDAPGRPLTLMKREQDDEDDEDDKRNRPTGPSTDPPAEPESRGKTVIMYEGRNILDLGSNIMGNWLEAPIRVPLPTYNPDNERPIAVHVCSIEDCNFCVPVDANAKHYRLF